MINKLDFLLKILFIFISSKSIELSACTIFHTYDTKGNVLIGRNFDWDRSGGHIWFIPGNDKKNSIVIFEQNGINMPFEGINNKGLFVGIAQAPTTDTPTLMLKPIRKSLEMVRVILEEANNVDEAIQLFYKYDVAFGKFLGYPQIHYKIVDKSGSSAIIDFIDKRIIVTKNSDKCKVMTNHYSSFPDIKTVSKTSFERYDSVDKALKTSHHSVKDIQKMLKSVSQKSTLWSNVYNVTNQKIFITYKNSRPFTIDIKDEMYIGKHGYNLENLNRKNPLALKEKKTTMLFRPHFGYGSLDGKAISHYGGRILLGAGEYRKYGLEITKFKNSTNNFTSIGIVLEQRLFGWFNMSIGTVGYFDYGKSDENIIGLTTNLGWEPDNHIPFKPFITYRNDVIFDGNTKVIHSISIGFDFEF